MEVRFNGAAGGKAANHSNRAASFELGDRARWCTAFRLLRFQESSVWSSLEAEYKHSPSIPCRFGRVSVPETVGGNFSVDPLERSPQNPAGAEFLKSLDAVGNHSLNRLAP